jgi:aryl-alcohol dehydrogenase-like predicted oxidoreductase
MPTTQPTTTLGAAGPSISRIGIGAWQAGGRGPWGGGPAADDAQAIAAVRTAVERGVTWVDTAASYGLGHSERVVAEALRPWRIGVDVLVFTKCGHPWRDDTPTTSLRPASIRAEVDGSLRRLGVDRLDLVQFHHPDPETPVEDSWGTLGDLVDEGKVRWTGVSNFPVELLDRCAAVRHVDVVQTELSLLRPAALESVLPWCRARGVGVLAYSPLASGVLARGDAGAPGLPPVDRDVVARVAALARTLECPPAAIAVAWVLATGAAAICGARRPDQVEDWLTAGELALPAVDLLGADAPATRNGKPGKPLSGDVTGEGVE